MLQMWQPTERNCTRNWSNEIKDTLRSDRWQWTRIEPAFFCFHEARKRLFTLTTCCWHLTEERSRLLALSILFFGSSHCCAGRPHHHAYFATCKFSQQMANVWWTRYGRRNGDSWYADNRGQNNEVMEKSRLLGSGLAPGVALITVTRTTRANTAKWNVTTNLKVPNTTEEKMSYKTPNISKAHCASSK